MPITIQPVETAADRRAFYRFAFRVYRSDPHWVPHLWPQRRAYLEKQAAFFETGEGAFWLAKRGRTVVGTLGTAVDPPRNAALGQRAATFGFFEVVPDYEVAAALWQHAGEWARARGLTRLEGPYSFNTHDEPGFLVEGHGGPPTIMMGHTPPYYAEYAGRFGFEKMKDTLAYRFELPPSVEALSGQHPLLDRIAERVLSRYGPGVIRHPDLARWEQELVPLHRVYNRALATLDDFSPISLAEFSEQALSLRPLLDPELVFIVQIGGQVVGFSLGLPNLMEALRHAGGLRYPWQYLQLARAQRRITGVSFKILAVDPDFWGIGLEALMFREMARAVMRKGYTWVDGSLTAEDNPQTNKLARRLGARVYRRYRIVRLAV